MDINTIRQIQNAYAQNRSHKEVMDKFGLTHPQEYAINVFGRDNQLSAEYLAERIDNLSDDMTIGEIAVALGFPAEAALK